MTCGPKLRKVENLIAFTSLFCDKKEALENNLKQKFLPLGVSLETSRFLTL